MINDRRQWEQRGSGAADDWTSVRLARLSVSRLPLCKARPPLTRLFTASVISTFFAVIQNEIRSREPPSVISEARHFRIIQNQNTQILLAGQAAMK
jgi:hypothetical protein